MFQNEDTYPYQTLWSVLCGYTLQASDLLMTVST